MVTLVPPSELGIAEIDGRSTDADVGAYLSNRSASGEYRDSARAIDCGVFKTFARTNLIRRVNG